MKLRRNVWWMIATLGFPFARPVLADRVHSVQGPRGGEATHVQGPRSGATHVQGPHQSGTVVHGRYGGSAAHMQGPYRSGTVVHGPYGGTAAYGRGPYGARTVYSRPTYEWHGAHYARPGWDVGRVNVYSRRFVGYPGYRAHGLHYGLVPALAAFPALAFLSAGILTASYYNAGQTVYVYVVNQGGQNIEYQVDEAGNILSATPVP